MVTITESTRRTAYQPVTPTNAFPVGFPIFDNDDLRVRINGADVTAYTVSATYVQGISTDAVVHITGSGVVGDVIVEGDRVPRRTDQYRNGAPLKIEDHNYSLNRVEVTLQELHRDVGESSDALAVETNARISGDILLNDRINQEAIQRKNADEAIIGLIGNIGSGNAPLFNTIHSVEISKIDPLVSAIYVYGYRHPGDYGGGDYIRVSSEPFHHGKIKSLDGSWWELAKGQIINPKMFGAVGDGVADDTEAVQNAIDFVCPFNWKGGTRATEEGSGSGILYVPKATFRLTSKLRLSPNLHIYGAGSGNDWTVRNSASGGPEKWGSALFFDYTNYQDYAIDTSPYHADGVRHDNDTLDGADSFNGLKTEVHNITIEDISIIGNYTTKGVNMAGAVFSKVRNVFLKGFTVGWRYTAVWYGVHENCRSWVSWKGLIAFMSVTDLALDNSSFQKGYDAPAYNVATMGRDNGLPNVSGWWVQAFNDATVGITNFYSCLTGRNICVEGFQIYSAARSAVNDFESVYIEGITYIAIVSMGPDQSSERHVFDTITTNSGDLIAQSQSRLEVGCRSTVYTQSGFNKLFYDILSDPINRPVVWGLKRNPTDVFANRTMKRSDVIHTEGEWSAVLKAGGVSLGTVSTLSRYVRVGNIVTVWGYIVLPTKTGATGALTIDGLPFRSTDRFGQFSTGMISFGYLSPAAGTLLVLENGRYEISIPNKTHSDIQNGADIRFTVTYETDTDSAW